MKWHILENLRERPWGGGNSFLSALRNFLQEIEIYEEDPFAADVILFNSYPSQNLSKRVKTLESLRDKNRSAVFIHRVDGPMSLSRGYVWQQGIDLGLLEINRRFADGTVFQSRWSLTRAEMLGFSGAGPVEVIHNAADPRYFYPKSQTSPDRHLKKVVMASWSSNPFKGTGSMAYLDEVISSSEIELFVIGPELPFSNVKTLPLMNGEELGAFFRSCTHILAPSRFESCSNSLIEGMTCGLTPLALDSSGHKELVTDARFRYSTHAELRSKIENASEWTENPWPHSTFASTAQAYMNFARSLKPREYASGGRSAIPLIRAYCTEQWTKISGTKIVRRLPAGVVGFTGNKLLGPISSGLWRPYGDLDDSFYVDIGNLKTKVEFFLNGMANRENPKLYRLTQSGDLSDSPIFQAQESALLLHRQLNLSSSAQLAQALEDFLAQEISSSHRTTKHRVRVQKEGLKLSSATQIDQIILLLTRAERAEFAISGTLSGSLLTALRATLSKLIHYQDWERSLLFSRHKGSRVFLATSFMFSKSGLDSPASDIFLETLNRYAVAIGKDRTLLIDWGHFLNHLHGIEYLKGVSLNVSRLLEVSQVPKLSNLSVNDLGESRMTLNALAEIIGASKAEVELKRVTLRREIRERFWSSFGGFSLEHKRGLATLEGERVSLGYLEPDLWSTRVCMRALENLM